MKARALASCPASTPPHPCLLAHILGTKTQEFSTRVDFQVQHAPLLRVPLPEAEQKLRGSSWLSDDGGRDVQQKKWAGAGGSIHTLALSPTVC